MIKHEVYCKYCDTPMEWIDGLTTSPKTYNGRMLIPDPSGPVFSRSTYKCPECGALFHRETDKEDRWNSKNIEQDLLEHLNNEFVKIFGKPAQEPHEETQEIVSNLIKKQANEEVLVRAKYITSVPATDNTEAFSYVSIGDQTYWFPSKYIVDGPGTDMAKDLEYYKRALRACLDYIQKDEDTKNFLVKHLQGLQEELSK